MVGNDSTHEYACLHAQQMIMKIDTDMHSCMAIFDEHACRTIDSESGLK